MKERSGMPYDVVAYEADENARRLTPNEEGIFHRMLRLAWMNGSVPADLDALADLCRVRPSTMQKAWPRLTKLWDSHPANPDRLVNNKQEKERIFVELKRDMARDAGKRSAELRAEKNMKDFSELVHDAGSGRKNLSIKTLRNKVIDSTDAERSGNLPPLPSPPLSSTIVEGEEGILPNAEKRVGFPDLAYDRFAAQHLESTGAEYVWKKGDFVQIAAMRKANHVKPKEQPNGWESAVVNYFASPLDAYSLAELCTHFPVLRNSALDRFRKPINHKGNGHESKSQQIERRNQESTRAALDLLDLNTVHGNGNGNRDGSEGDIRRIAPRSEPKPD